MLDADGKFRRPIPEDPRTAFLPVRRDPRPRRPGFKVEGVPNPELDAANVAAECIARLLRLYLREERDVALARVQAWNDAPHAVDDPDLARAVGALGMAVGLARLDGNLDHPAVWRGEIARATERTIRAYPRNLGPRWTLPMVKVGTTRIDGIGLDLVPRMLDDARLLKDRLAAFRRRSR